MATRHFRHFADRFVTRLIHGGPPLDGSAQEDLSYEDALLDLEIRSLLRSEYGAKEPPSGLFYRLMRAIQVYDTAQSRNAIVHPGRLLLRPLYSLGQAFASLYRTAARSNGRHLLSSGLVATLVALTMWSQMITALNGSGSTSYTTGTLPVATQSVAGEDRGPSPWQKSVHPAEQASADTAVPTILVAPPDPSGVVAPPQRISAAALREQSRLRLEQHIGEDLGASTPSYSPLSPPDSPSTSSEGLKPRSSQDDGQLCLSNNICAK